MKAVLSIAWRDLQALFLSLKAYVVITLLLGLYGLFFYAVLADAKEASLRDMFQVMNFFGLFVIPVITMGSLADERKAGTLELLLTCPVTRFQVVAGKVFAAAAFYTLFVSGATLQFYALISLCGTPDPGPVFTGFLGMLLSGYMFIAVGVYASSLTRSSLVAALLGYAPLLGIFVASAIGNQLPAWISELIGRMSFVDRLTTFERGIVKASDVWYFVIGTLFWITVTTLGFNLERDNPLA